MAILVVLAMNNLLVYQYALTSQFEGIRNNLTMLAQTAALMVDAKEFQAVPISKDGVRSPAFQAIAAKLSQIKSVNPGIRYIYTLTRTGQPGIWQFVVDPEPRAPRDDRGFQYTSLPGDTYNAARFPEMMRAYERPSADRKLEKDEWGVTLSGYAPIRDDAGRAIGVLGVDIMADDIYAMRKDVHNRAMAIFFVGILGTLILGWAVSSRISDPVNKLIEGTRSIARGELDHRVDVHGGSEIGDLARSFNHMAENLQDYRGRLLNYFYDVVRSLVHILELRDEYTRGHSEGVAEYAGKIAMRMGYPEKTIDLLQKMTLLHDIGKLGVRDSILNKPGPLTEEEWKEMRRHPLIGEDILKPVIDDKEMLAVVRGHHERYDGNGYPDKLKDEQLNIFAAIVSVADAYHAMTTDRAYRKALSRNDAIAELKRCRGTQFHPKVVDTFLQILEEERSVTT